MEKRFNLPQWMLDAFYAEVELEYQATIKALEPSIGISWYNDELRITCFMEDEEVASRQVSLAEICEEPAEYWQGNGQTDQFHYDMIGKIADALDSQAKRLRDAQSKLTVRFTEPENALQNEPGEPTSD